MGNESSAGMATAGAALGSILSYLLGMILGPLPETIAGAIITLTTFVFCYILPSGLGKSE